MRCGLHELGRAVVASFSSQPKVLGDELAGVSDTALLPTVGTPTPDELDALEGDPVWWKREWAAAARRTIAEKGGLAEHLAVEVQ